MTAEKDIHDANFILGHAARPDCDIIGVITYEGDIGAAEPQEIHIDTQLKKLSVIFNDGSQKDVFDLTSDNVNAIDTLCQDISKAQDKTGKKSLTVDFNQVDPKETGTKFFKKCYRVDALVI